jgi:photosystem II stability/assembly factor-like uncharacterized protein
MKSFHRLLAFVPALLLCLGLPLMASASQAGPQREDADGRSALPMKVGSSFRFREIGPAITGGRVTAVAGVPGNPNVYFVGAADGGIFRTEDGGTTWEALFQHQSVASIGALAIAARNPALIWAGTGEANVRNDVSFGDGIYKSTDAGRTWKRMGLDRTFQISRIVISPSDPDTVLVAAMGSPWQDSPDRGVYRTTDGGVTWNRVLYVGADVGISDLAMDPRNSAILFAATYRYRRTPWNYADGGPEDGIYRSVDGGASWTRLKDHGLPTQPVSRVGLAIAASSPNVVYAVMGSKEGVLWRSDDSGGHWVLVNKDEVVDARPYYFSRIEVDPKNADHVFALSSYLMASDDSGRSFHRIAKAIHVDHHAMWIDPTGSGRVLDGNDGGVALSLDNGRHWRFVHNLVLGQFYHLALGLGVRYQLCGGLQDNGSWCGLEFTKDPAGISDGNWIALGSGDGIDASPAADNPNLIYNSTSDGHFKIYDRVSEQLRDIKPYQRDINGWPAAQLPYRFIWEAPFAVSPGDARVLYGGGNVLFKSEDRGSTWRIISPDLSRNDKTKQGPSGGPVIEDDTGAEYYDAILTITVAPSDPKVIWIGTDDGLVQLTRDGGKHWANLTTQIRQLPPWGQVESIDVSARDPGNALIAVDRHLSGDFRPYLYRTDDYGAHWTSISGNLPEDVYAHVVRRDLRNAKLYYAGLENGLYISWDAGVTWYLFGLGLPSAAVYDLALDEEANSLALATHGRGLWILDDLTPFQRWTLQVARAGFTLFKPEDALRFWPRSQSGSFGDGAFHGQNPPYGAAIDYYLAKPAGQPGELVIADASGGIVRTLRGAHEGNSQAMTPVMQSSVPHPTKSSKVPERGVVPWVPTEAGLHRIYWDLRADGPVRWMSVPPFNRGPTDGALLPPGSYTATLKIGGLTASQTFTVVNDPASHTDTAKTAERYRVTEAVLHEVSQLDAALNSLHALDTQLEVLEAAANGSRKRGDAQLALGKLSKAARTVTLNISSGATNSWSTLRRPNRIHEHLLELDSVLEGEDTPVTAATLQQNVRLEEEYRSALAGYDHFMSVDVAAFNRRISRDGLTAVAAGPSLAP